MLRCYAFVCLTAIAGCRAGSGIVENPAEAGEVMVQMKDLLVDAGQPLQKQAELNSFSGRYPLAVESVSKGTHMLVWGKGIREGISGKAEIIAYPVDAEKNGGWVVRENAKLEKLTADDFKKEAPKKSTPKK